MSKDSKFPSAALQAAEAMERALRGSLAYDAMLTNPGAVAYAEAMKTEATLKALIQPSGLAADAEKFLADLSIKDPYLSQLPPPSYAPAVTQKAATSTPTPEPVRSSQALGQRVRQAREAMGMTQAAFADAAGVGRRFVSELENGKATLELGKVMTVCAAAGLDLLVTSR